MPFLLLLAALSSLDLKRLETYGTAWGDPGNTQALAEQARAEFGGRGIELADYFLRHTGPRPRNDAYYFVLQAIADTDTVLTLVRGLVAPPPRESGALDRHFGEIGVAIEAALDGETTRRDPRVVAALEQALAAARAKPYGSGAAEAEEAVRLLGLCAGEAAMSTLARLAGDPDPAIRHAAAAALGGVERRGGAESAAPPAAAASAAIARSSPAGALVLLLASDPDAAARRQAAESLGAIDAPETVPALQAALITERDARVIDAVVQSLRRRGAPVVDPGQCRDLIGLAWEAGVAEQLLECWRRSGVTTEDLIQTALSGPATRRAMALVALSAPAAPSRSIARAAAPIAPRFDPAIRDRLLTAAVSVLSEGDAISPSTRDGTEQALWHLSEASMGRALEFADAVTPNAARFRASAALARADAGAYDAVRRAQQATLALLVALGSGALGFLLLGILGTPLGRASIVFAVSALGWAAWTLQASGVPNLPPPPMQLLSVAAIAFLSAGATVGLAALIPSGRPRRPRLAAALRGVATMAAAGVAAALVCGATRNARLFPSGMGGWELIFDPLGAGVVAFAAAAILVIIDGAVRWPRAAGS